MIRQCQPPDTERLYFIINEAARAYEGAIPDDCYPQPYMPMSELEAEMRRVTFYGWQLDGELVGVMGLEPIKDTTLIRHAYVLPRWQRQGISTRLLEYIKPLVKTRRLMVGTWADATWAIDFYKKHGFELMPDKDELLKTYWDIPQRQIETSVVLGVEVG
ncbi:MAG: GNAT family N-acetyltransferase [Dehalococcoidia bacterium]|jgi:GNAT superfamily N-acetyltransferase